MEKLLAKTFGIDPKIIDQLKDIVSIVSVIMPKFEYRQLDGDAGSYAAILFEHTPENIRRVGAIGEMLTDILPAFTDEPAFSLDENGKVTTYAALLFPIPKEASKDGGKDC